MIFVMYLPFLLVEIKFIKRVSYTCIYLDTDCVGVCVEGLCSDTCKYELSCTLGRTCQGGRCFYQCTDNTACPSDGQICHHGVCKEGCQVSTSVRIKMSAPSACEKTCSLSSECTQHQTCSSGTCKSTISSGCSGTLTAKYLLSSVTPCLKCVRSRFSWDLNVLGSNCGAAFSHFTVLKMNNVDLSSLNAYPTYAISFILSTVHIFLILSRTDSLMIGWIYRMLV
ncbi:hypothetical protein EB796_003155 [Bugula neritina]|uniref:Uncharacterized protein n=1 Tax=Bugula neritina TaxID=10212 RepID=A0A7J7KKS6_BUGNE|nr:hypothetical protein EB796_003155 [Bugula neritina]